MNDVSTLSICQWCLLGQFAFPWRGEKLCGARFVHLGTFSISVTCFTLLPNEMKLKSPFRDKTEGEVTNIWTFRLQTPHSNVSKAHTPMLLWSRKTGLQCFCAHQGHSCERIQILDRPMLLFLLWSRLSFQFSLCQNKLLNLSLVHCNCQLSHEATMLSLLPFADDHGSFCFFVQKLCVFG